MHFDSTGYGEKLENFADFHLVYYSSSKTTNFFSLAPQSRVFQNFKAVTSRNVNKYLKAFSLEFITVKRGDEDIFIRINYMRHVSRQMTWGKRWQMRSSQKLCFVVCPLNPFTIFNLIYFWMFLRWRILRSKFGLEIFLICHSIRFNFCWLMNPMNSMKVYIIKLITHSNLIDVSGAYLAVRIRTGLKIKLFAV